MRVVAASTESIPEHRIRRGADSWRTIVISSRAIIMLGAPLALVACASDFGSARHEHHLPPTAQLPTNAAPRTTPASEPVVDAKATDGSARRPVDFGDQTIAQHPDRPTAIIGIFGESISHSSTTSGFGDGASNITQVTFARDGQDFDPDTDSTGQRLVYASTQHRRTADLYLKGVNGSTVTQLTSDPGDDVMPEFSPDGAWIAFASNRAGNFDLYVMPVSGGQPRSLSTDASDELHPTWSPDGRTLAYCRFGEQSQRWELWTVDVDNPSVRNFVDYGFLPEWSPDPAQNKILFQRAKERGSRYHSIWTIDYVDGQGRNPTEIASAANAAVINPSWSPDGSHIVFATIVEPESQPSEKPVEADLWIVRLDGTGRTNLTNGFAANYQPTWGANGLVYFVSDRGGNDNLWSVAARWSSRDGDAAESSVATATEGE
jgi:TolB protein